MINRIDSWQKRVVIFLAFVIVGSLIGILAYNNGVHYIVAGMIIMLPGLWIAYRASTRNGYMFLYLLTSMLCAFVIPNYFADLLLSAKGSATVNHLREIKANDVAVYKFVDAHIEKEKYGNYLYEFRGHQNYFVAPLVNNGWHPTDTVFAFAAFTTEAPWEKLVFEDSQEVVLDSTINAVDTATAVSIGDTTNNETHEDAILYLDWNQNYSKGLRLNHDFGRYSDAVKNASINHQLLSAKEPVLVLWTDSPEEELNSQKLVNGLMSGSLLLLVFIWLAILEIKIARTPK